MVAVPDVRPFTWPDEAFRTLATAGELLAHVPPVTSLLNVMIPLTHTAFGPLIVPAEGSGLTVISADALAVPQVVLTV
jgi:hypothetical protein